MNTKPTTQHIAKNPSIELVVKTINNVAQAGTSSLVVQKLASLFPYRSYQNKLDWLEAIYNWIHQNTTYEFDEPNKEQIKKPDRLVFKDKKGDCDDFTVLWKAILINQNIRHWGKVVKYDAEGNWAHVYVQVPTKEGPVITLDNVLKNFNEEVTYSKDIRF